MTRRKASPDLVQPFAPDETDNLLIGRITSDALEGLAGNDTIFGRDGNDDLAGDHLDLTVSAMPTGPLFGDDVLFTGAGGDLVAGDARDLEILDANGSLEIATGADTIVGSPEYGWLHGDAETLVVQGDGVPGGMVRVAAGDDLIVAANGAMYGDAQFIQVFDLDGGSATFLLGDDILLGGQSLYGDAYNLDVRFDTSGGDVTVVAGDDLLIAGPTGGGAYGDFYVAELSLNRGGGSLSVVMGDDTIYGGAGNDLLTGDANWITKVDDLVLGADRFVFAGDFGNDTIVDFNLGLDTLVFEGFGALSLDDLDMSLDRNGDLVIDMAALGGGRVTLNDVEAIAQGDVIFV